MTHLVGIDIGTTRVKAVLLDEGGSAAAAAERAAPLAHPRPGWAETDAEAIVAAAVEAAREAVGAAGVAAVGIANQRSTTVLWDRATGRPVAPAISWRCLRAEKIAEAARARLGGRYATATGLPLAPYWFAAKLAWLLENVPGARAGARDGRLAAGTLDSFALHRLTDGAVHATDVSNAARTGLLDIRTLDWSDEILEVFRVPRACLPEVRPSAGRFGETGALGGRIAIAGAAGDAGAALLGLAPAGAKVTLGTGAFVHVATPGRVAARGDLFAAPAYDIGPDPSAERVSRGAGVRWTLEGSIPSAGAGLEWVRRVAGVAPEDAPPVAADGPVLVPAFAGLGAPAWDSRVRGAIVGLTDAHGPADLAAAALEAVAQQVADVVEALEGYGARPARLVADGGLARRADLLALIAALAGVEVAPALEADSTARGAALLAGIGAGLWPPDGVPPARVGPPVPPAPIDAGRRRSRWRAAVVALRDLGERE